MYSAIFMYIFNVYMVVCLFDISVLSPLCVVTRRFGILFSLRDY